MVDEAASDGDVGRVVAIGLQKRLDGARIMLPVAVDLDAEIKILTRRVFDAGLHGAADAEILREAGDRRAAACHRGCRVRRAVVDDQGVVAAAGCCDLAQETADRGLLVEAGNDDEDSRRALLRCGSTAAARVS
jgi:hypothetical protein